MQFPAEEKLDSLQSGNSRSAQLQEKLDIHRKLFEHAWRIDGGRSGTG